MHECWISANKNPSKSTITLQTMIKKLEQENKETGYILNFEEINIDDDQKKDFIQAMSKLLPSLKTRIFHYTGYIPNHANKFKLEDFLSMLQENKYAILSLNLVPIDIENLNFSNTTEMKLGDIIDNCQAIKEIFQHHFKYPDHLFNLKFFFKVKNIIAKQFNYATFLSVIQKTNYNDNEKKMNNPFTKQNNSILYETSSLKYNKKQLN